jgi:hypothetical protein
VLVADQTWGLALSGTNGSGVPHTYGVYWPDSYSGRWQDGIATLLDESGTIVARAGDQVILDGKTQDPLYVCTDLLLVSPSPTV